MKSDFSFQSVKTLFKLDLKSRFGTTQKIGVKNRLMQVSNYLFFAVVYAVLILGIVYLSKIFINKANLEIGFLTLSTMVTMLLATAISTGTVIKNLYMNGDNELLLRFPVSGTEVLVSKSIYCYIHNLVVCFATMLPFYITFGVETHAPVGDYFSYIAVILFSSLLPYFVANIIAVPVMKVMNYVKNQFLLVLIFTIAAVCGAFVLYMSALSSIVDYLTEANKNIFSAEVIEVYQHFADNAYPFNFYAYLINGKRYADMSSGQMALNFLYLLLINGGLGALAFFITTKAYYRTILYGIETEKTSFKKKVRNRKRNVFHAILHKEFFLILRSFNYSFQYLAMACAAPFMVFFCSRLAVSMGTKSIGATIMPGLMLMIIIIFVTIIVSFASTSISREGNCFYLTKVIPVSYTKQVLTKFFLYSIVAIVSVAVCCAVTGGYYTQPDEEGISVLSKTDVLSIFGISEMVVMALTCLSMWADIKMPTFNVAGDGELVKANKNVALSMIVGMVVAVAYGVFAMVFSLLPFNIGEWHIVRMNNVSDIYVALSVVSAVLLAASATLMFVKLNKRYQNIAP
ncbi:MAG: hypothetical protein IK048_04345 [Clostridia bacterium]|nr:hypothetical protein [Clostridia bacterium]